MLVQREIVVLALCCLMLSVPVSYFVNVYRQANFIHPYDVSMKLIKLLPFLVFSSILCYGAYHISRLIKNGKHEDATRFATILMVLAVIAIALGILTFDIGTQYIL